MIWTIPLVMVIAMKYSMDVENHDEGDPTSVILRDKLLLLLILIYSVIMAVAVYMS